MSWYALLSIVQDMRDESYLEPHVKSCPHDGEPLRSGPDGQLYCPFDGWRPDGSDEHYRDSAR